MTERLVNVTAPAKFFTGFDDTLVLIVFFVVVDGDMEWRLEHGAA